MKDHSDEEGVQLEGKGGMEEKQMGISSDKGGNLKHVYCLLTRTRTIQI